MQGSNDGRTRDVRHVDAGDSAGQRVDNFLLREMPGVPRSRIYGMLRKGEVRVNGGRIRPDYRLKPGDLVRVPPWHGPIAGEPGQPSAGLLDVLSHRLLYEDAAVIVLDKPPGLAVHGGSGISHGVIEMLRAMFPDESGLELAHRLDRDTSGCLVVARNRAALMELHTAFRDGSVAKNYDVLVYGTWPRKLRSVRAHLERYVTRTGERRVRVLADGKPARTEFNIVERNDRASWLKAHPHTGRTHQIRVHSLTSGHPVVGDEKYASDTLLEQSRALGIARLCLHATSVAIPVGGKVRRFDAPLPQDFIAAWRRLSGA
ncbi:MAG TPA: RluA family pseudouridine synthase [Pseudomonadales bacterium]